MVTWNQENVKQNQALATQQSSRHAARDSQQTPSASPPWPPAGLRLPMLGAAGLAGSGAKGGTLPGKRALREPSWPQNIFLFGSVIPPEVVYYSLPGRLWEGDSGQRNTANNIIVHISAWFGSWRKKSEGMSEQPSHFKAGGCPLQPGGRMLEAPKGRRHTRFWLEAGYGF